MPGLNKKTKTRRGYSRLNAVQQHLLDLFALRFSKNELTELQDLLVKYYEQKVTDEAGKIWKERKLNNTHLDKLLKAS